MSAVSRRLMRIRAYQIDDARRDLTRAITLRGEDSPAAAAARGRLWVYARRVPQVGAAPSIEAVAWARESGGRDGRPIWNRRQRRHAAETFAARRADLFAA